MLQRIRHRQAGMVSIMVTLVMMLVISLIVLGFAQVSRREQRQTLDRQLSTQAFFAAESGINDARDVIRKAQALGNPIPEKADCEPDSTYTANPKIDATNGVSYPCLLVTTRLKDITINPLTAGADTVNVPLEPAGTMSSVRLNWKPLTTPTAAAVAKCKATMPTNGYFPRNAAADWDCPYGVVRVDFVPTGTLSRAAMTAGQKTVYFYPTRSTGTSNIDFANANGDVAEMKCQVASGCAVNLINVPSGTYGLRISSVYVTGALNLAAHDAGGSPLELKNAQIQIDATGKALDVLRRIQVRLPVTPSPKTPDYALESASSICKRLQIYSSGLRIPADIQGQDHNNPMCRPMTVLPPEPPPSTEPCTNRGPNLVQNGDFSRNVGAAALNHLIDPAVWAFSTKLPNRGPNQFPDDQGANGAGPDNKGWTGGMSVFTVNNTMLINGNNVLLREFAGEPALGVPGSKTMLMTNPNQSIDEPRGTDRVYSYTGVLWETTLTGLEPNATYDFSGYFANVLTQDYLNLVPGAASAQIEFSVDGKIIRSKETMSPDGTQWHRITLQFTTEPGQTSAVFAVKDFAGVVAGDDFAMTGMGVYKCNP